jgi:hypothetical protein
MKVRIAVLAVLCISLVCIGNQVFAQQQKMTVLNPMGTPPPIQAKQMAPRPETLDGKTVYFVNTGYIGTDRLMKEMMDWFKENYPKTKLELRSGSMESIPQNVLSEIGEKADAAIVGLGH